jgi:hypothetical protein
MPHLRQQTLGTDMPDSRWRDEFWKRCVEDGVKVIGIDHGRRSGKSIVGVYCRSVTRDRQGGCGIDIVWLDEADQIDEKTIAALGGR